MPSIGVFQDSFPDYLEDAQYLLMPREVQQIDNQVRKVIYRNAVAPKIFPTKQIPKGSRDWRVPIAKKPSPVIFTKDFLDESFDKIDKEEKTFYLIGLMKDYFISMVEIDASRNSRYYNEKLDALHLREMTALITATRERIFWRGYDIKDAKHGAIDSNVKGILTATGINEFTGNALGAAGDGPAAMADAVGQLVVDKYIPAFDTVMTPWVFAQLAKNMNVNTHVSDLERMKGMTDQNDRMMIRNIYIHDALLNTDDDGTASAWVFLAPKNLADEDTVQLLESYPIWHFPMNTSQLGIRGKLICMAGSAVIRADAICLETAIDVDG